VLDREQIYKSKLTDAYRIFLNHFAFNKIKSLHLTILTWVAELQLY